MKHIGRCGLMAGTALVIALTSPSFAAGDTTGTVAQLFIDQGRVLITLSVPPAGSRPACATGSYAGVIDLSASWAQTFYAGLLTAQARGTQVRIFGTNSCTVANTTEDVSRIYTFDN